MRGALGLAGWSAITLFAAGCSEGDAQTQPKAATDPTVRVAGRLDCPEREGDLRLQSTAGDGHACAYRSRDGADVELRLASADELPALETQLSALVPTATPAAAPRPLAPAGRRAKEGGDGRFTIPGVMDVQGEGERASVRLPGVRVEADGDKAEVRIGEGNGREDVFVRAHDGGAVVRISEDEKAGEVRSTFLVTSEQAGPSGLRLAGYQARGSRLGPMVIAVMRARGERDNDLMDDVEDLIDRNVED